MLSFVKNHHHHNQLVRWLTLNGAVGRRGLQAPADSRLEGVVCAVPVNRAQCCYVTGVGRSTQARGDEGASVGARRPELLCAAPLSARAWLGAWRLRKHAWQSAAATPLSVLAAARPHVGQPPARSMCIAPSAPRRRHHRHRPPRL